MNLKKLSFFFASTGNDLDSIRALFSEKEKELSLAVAKVEALTRQLEELRRDRRGLSLITNNGNNQQPPSQSARELEKLRRELMVRKFAISTTEANIFSMLLVERRKL